MAACAALGLAAAPSASAQASTPVVTLTGQLPALVGSSAQLGPVMGVQPVSLALTLPLRNQAMLSALLHDLYDASSPSQGKFLTSQQFIDSFGPVQTDYDAVIQYAKSKGLTVTGTNPSRTIVDVTGAATTVGQAFGVHLMRYLDSSGREFYAPDANPTIDASIAKIAVGVLGLDNATFAHPAAVPHVSTGASPAGIGTDPHDSGLTPSDIKSVYNLNNTGLTGASQSVGVFELSNFQPNDIRTYESQFGLPNVPLKFVAVDGGATSTSAPDEVAGDIELEIAVAPGASQIVAYFAPNTYQGEVDQFARIANDNTCKAVSTSWTNNETVPSGRNDESSIPSQMVSAENSAFQQMAAQGQSIYAASGDTGAYANGSYLGTLDPASQPYVCGVGGTTLQVNNPNTSQISYYSETSWATPSDTRRSSYGAGSGGGISAIWPIPYYQSLPGVYTGSSQGSTKYRNVPDVSLDADPNTGYSIYFSDSNGQNGKWQEYGGTSFAAPLWAGFTALVNQGRATNYGLAPLGFANPYLYGIGLGVSNRYAQDFYDITRGNNLYYPAVAGYDDATGWGSFNGANLLGTLEGTSAPNLSPQSLYALGTLPFYRLYWSQYNVHYYTTDIADAYTDTQNGFSYEGVQCHIYGGSGYAGSLTPLYRLYNTNNHDHFLTVDTSEVSSAQSAGYQSEGIKGYVFPYSYPSGAAPPAGTVPLYRAYNSSTGEHFYTTDYNDYSSRTSPWRQEGVRAYVLP